MRAAITPPPAANFAGHPLLNLFEHRSAQQFQRTAGYKGFGYGVAEVGGGGADGGFFEDVGYLIAVGADYHGVKVPVVVDLVAVGAEGELAASA